jgi:hypothetical protein
MGRIVPTCIPQGMIVPMKMRFALAVVSTWACLAAAQQNSYDRFFVVSSASTRAISFFESPAVNDAGDIAVKATTGTTKEIDVYLGSQQITPNPTPGSIPFLVVRTSTGNLSGFPKINNRKAVVSLNFQSSQFVLDRYDYSASPTPTYAGVRIARGNSTQTLPFQFISGLADLDDATPANVYFYAERQPLTGPYNYRIYGSATEVATPAASPTYASRPDVFTTLDMAVVASGNGNVVYRGTGPSGLGIYKSAANTPVATLTTGFSVIGQNPKINNSSTVAFYGEYGPAATPPGIYLRLAGEAVPRRAGTMADPATPAALVAVSGAVPNVYLPNDHIALNDFNQVAFIGVDDDLNAALYTTTMGSIRRLIGIGSPVAFNNTVSSIDYLRLFEGLGTNGQVVFLAGLANGDEVLLRAARGFTQAKLNDSPIVPSYQDTYYLRSSLSDGGVVNKRKIRAVGCNLVSTVNLMNFYNITVSPIDYQSWLTDKWKNAPTAQKSRYITANNDPPEEIITEFTLDMIRKNLGQKVVIHLGKHNRAKGSNLGKIISEIRDARAVKLRVPNGLTPQHPAYQRIGHFVLAYGLKDPSRNDAQLTKEDILIMDPGNGGIYTLGAYGAKGYDQHNANWLEDGDDRVYLYSASAPTLVADVLDLTLSLRASASSLKSFSGTGGPVDLVLHDSAGHRLGADPLVGEFDEIPGGDYILEESYSVLDSEPDSSDLAWDLPAEKHIKVQNPGLGICSIELIGNSTADYTLTAAGYGSATTSLAPITGTLTAGQRLQFAFSVAPAPPTLFPPVTLPDGNLRIEALTVPGRLVTLEQSLDLQQWSVFATNQATNGTVTFLYASTNAPGQFFRAR